MKTYIEADLPYPVSVNRMYRAYKGRVIKSSTYRAWENSVKSVAIAALASDFDGVYSGLGSSRVRLSIWVYPPDRRKRDIGNLLKGIEDALEAAGWIKNDEQEDEIHIYRCERSKHDPRVSVKMEVISTSEV
jgi:crossover junction endodeoxyribonuclease RusA